MQSFVHILILFLVPVAAVAQTTITGKVTDPKQQPLPGVNVYIKGTIDGGTSDLNGVFAFTAETTGKQTLIASMIGMESYSREVVLEGSTLHITITLKETVSELNAVEITAGSFDAGDVKKAAVLNSIDIATTAGATADIIGALQTLPGTLPSMEESGLLVRGGEAAESKAFFDGVLVSKMFPGGVPDISQRGRFSPFLFKGTSFSTGAYSAQYGNSLSSVMQLESRDVEKKSKAEIGLMSVGADAGYTAPFKNSSLEAKLSYYNLKPVFSILEQNTRWTHEPESVQGNLFYKHQTGERGMLRIFGCYENSHTGISTYNREDFQKQTTYDIRNSSLYLNSTWSQFISERVKIYAGAGFGNDDDDIAIDKNRAHLKDRSFHGKVVTTLYYGKLSDLTVGGEYFHFGKSESYNDQSRELDRGLLAAFAETNTYIGRNFTVRPGVRFEHSKYNGESSIAPRLSAAYRLSPSSTLSAGYGLFYQLPDEEYLFADPDVTGSRAEHTVINYQYRKNKRTFRAEAYHKNYRNLVLEQPELNNDGYGYARGLDLFYRDSDLIRYADFWISYSYLDTRRKFRDYPSEATPDFASEHVLNAVGKYFVSSIKTSLGATYTYASGRPYHNPNNPTFLGNRTRDYHNFSVNISYLTSIGGQFTIVYLSVENVFAIKNVYGYRYYPDGTTRKPILPSSPRSIFLGVFLTIN